MGATKQQQIAESEIEAMPAVYIAGPLGTGEDVAANVRRALEMWHELDGHGFTAYCPHLSHFLALHQPRSLYVWMRHDFAWLRRCDCLLRLKGKSAGADKEVAYAESIGVPVFESVQALVAHHLVTGRI